MTTQTAPVSLPAELVLFDGVCGFCDWSVQWLLEHDPDQRFHFATLQGETAAGLRERHPEIPRELDTVVFVVSDGSGESVWMRSAAVFAILRRLRGPWRWLAVFSVLPVALTDLGYRAFAAIRYRVFGRRDTCRVPSPDERSRFLA